MQNQPSGDSIRGLSRLGRAAAVVALSISLVCGVRFLLDDWLVDHLPYLLFLGAVATTTRISGWRAGASAVVAALVTGSYFFTRPRFALNVGGIDTLLEALLFVAVSATVIAMQETEARLRRRLQLSNQQLRIAHTQSIQLERELEIARRLESVGRLAGGIAHDFNNLLTVILGSAELLHADLPNDRSLASISLAAERGADLTQQLLRFARREPLRLKSMSVNDAVRANAPLVERLLPEDVLVEHDLLAELWPVEGDPSQVQQVLLNLVTNARDALPRGGLISVQTRNVTLDASFGAQHPEVSPGEYVLLRVSDTGCGLSEEVRQHVFEPFFTTKKNGLGTGLGLAVVYGIIKQLRGHVFVQSKVDVGTSFEVYWPRSKNSLATPSEERIGSDNQPSHRLRVLLVEDDDAVRAVTAELLRGLGHEVIARADGASTLQTLHDSAEPIDVLVTDVVMPGMNGKELADQVQRTRPGTPVVFVSGYTDDIILVHGVMRPDVFLVRKPFSSREIERVLRLAVSGQSAAAS